MLEGKTIISQVLVCFRTRKTSSVTARGVPPTPYRSRCSSGGGTCLVLGLVGGPCPVPGPRGTLSSSSSSGGGATPDPC